MNYGCRGGIFSAHEIRLAMLAISLLWLASCGEELMMYETNTSTPIVEGYLTTGASSLSVRVYSMESFNADDNLYSNPIKGLALYVNDRKLTENADGTYSLNIPDEMLVGGNSCNLKFDYKNQTVSASTTMPTKIQNLKISQSVIYQSAYSGWWSNYNDTTNVTITWDNPDNSFYQVYIWSLDESSTGRPSFGGGNFGRMMMQPFQGNSYTLRGHDISFSGRYVCYLYKINKDYAELYERISSSDLANPVSFIEHGLGVFTGISADTISYRVEEIED